MGNSLCVWVCERLKAAEQASAGGSNAAFRSCGKDSRYESAAYIGFQVVNVTSGTGGYSVQHINGYNGFTFYLNTEYIFYN